MTYFVRALWSSFTTLFTHLKCTIQWILVYMESYTVILKISFRIFSSSQEESLDPLAVPTHVSAKPNLEALSQHTNLFLSPK